MLHPYEATYFKRAGVMVPLVAGLKNFEPQVGERFVLANSPMDACPQLFYFLILEFRSLFPLGSVLEGFRKVQQRAWTQPGRRRGAEVFDNRPISQCCRPNYGNYAIMMCNDVKYQQPFITQYQQPLIYFARLLFPALFVIGAMWVEFLFVSSSSSSSSSSSTLMTSCGWISLLAELLFADLAGCLEEAVLLPL